MKKLLIGSALILSSFSFAQIDFRSSVFGLTAGGTYSRVRNAHNPSGARYSVLGGLVYTVPVGTTEQFYLQAEAVYLGGGEGGDRKYEKDRNKPHAVYAANYISVPISFKAYFSEAESEFFALGGPRFNFLVSQKVTNPSSDSYKEETYGKANSFNFGLGLGLGYSYKRNLELTVRYDLGLSDAYPDLKYSPSEIATADPAVAKKKSEHIMSLALTYFFK